MAGDTAVITNCLQHQPMLTQICWHKDKWLSPAMRAFLEVIREVMVEKP